MRTWGTWPSVTGDDDRFAEDVFDADRGVLGDGGAVARLRDLVDQLLADPAAHLADAALRDRHDDPAGLPDQIGGADVGGGLLAVQERGDRVDRAAEHDAAGEAGDRRGGRREAVVDGDGAGAAERGEAGLARGTVGDIMTSPAITAHPDTPMHTIAEIMVKEHINRVPIERDGKLVGMVTRADVLGTIAGLTHKTIDLRRDPIVIGSGMTDALISPS